MANLNELQGQLSAIKADVTEGLNEIRAKIDEQNAKIAQLTEQLGNVQIPDDASVTLAELKELGVTLANLVPQPPPPEPPPAP